MDFRRHSILRLPLLRRTPMRCGRFLKDSPITIRARWLQFPRLRRAGSRQTKGVSGLFICATTRVGPTAKKLLPKTLFAHGNERSRSDHLLHTQNSQQHRRRNSRAKLRTTPTHFGARAINEHTLQVTLQHADTGFPALVAHPVFRPVKVPDADQTNRLESHELISNGAFLLSATETDKVQLQRAKTYWDDASVALDRVTFVNTTNAEDALSAYQAGEIDAITNAPFEPLALKLLAPYKDFRRSTFGALTYYGFNTSREPFDDVRVREALALAIDRERVSRDDLGGATEPAGKFLPEAMSGEKPVVDQTELLEYDVNKARELLAQAGYPNGEGFPVIRLLINRNEQQRIVAQSIAAMWRSALNIETEIVDPQLGRVRSGDRGR